MLNLLVVFCLIRVFCVLRGPLFFYQYVHKVVNPHFSPPGEKCGLDCCLRRSDINIISVYLRSSVDFFNVHLGLYR